MTTLKSTALVILAVSSLAACGPHFTANKQNDLTTDALTEAQNPYGRSYTSFSSPTDVQAIKDQISTSVENKNFASQVESIEVATKQKTVEVSVHWKGLNKALLFQGRLEEKDSNFSALLNDKTGQKRDFELNANCNSLKCETLNAFLKDQAGNLIGLIVKQENRDMKLVETSTQKNSYKLLSKEKQNAIAQAKKGLSVTLRSVEVYPGRSYYEIKQGESTMTGELLSIDEGSAPTQTTGIFATLGYIELIGNNQGDSSYGGELQFKVTNQAQQTSVVSYLQMDSSINLMQHQMPHSPPQAGVHTLVQQILDEENNEIVKSYIAAHYAPKQNLPKTRSQSAGVEEVSLYLACEEGNSNVCKRDKTGHDKSATVKTMVQVLRQNGFPAAWSLVSFMESHFEPNVRSSSGALGYWQFLASTGRAFNIVGNGKDLRTNLTESTAAATRYFKLLLDSWNGDVKMAIISYNMGQGDVQKACNRGSDNTANCNIAKNQRQNEHREMADIYDLNKKDFWRLYNLHVFGSVSRNGSGAQEYTLKFLSQNIVSFHPLKYGYGNKAVDLN